MSVDRQKALLFASAASLRLLLFNAFPTLPDLLTGRVEISTPVTSFKRLQEGLFLYTHNLNPYDGGVFHQAPLLLPLFSLLPNALTHPFATYLLYTIIDLVSAEALAQISGTGEAVSSRLFTSPRKDLRWSSNTIAASFLFSPFTVATCLARPTSVVTNCLILHAVAKAATGRSVTFILALSLASYLSFYPILLFPPLALLCYDAQVRCRPMHSADPFRFTLFHLGLVVSILGLLLYTSHLIVGSWQFLASTYGVQLLLPDLTPNVGLWWYFFIEMFDSFRNFFLGIFWLHMMSYVGGLTLRLRKQPLFVVCCLLGVFAVFAPYPSVADAGLFLGVLPMWRHVFPLMRYTFFTIAALLYATFLGPAFYYLWIYTGSGNANFFYAITLVWSLGLTIIVADALYAVLRDEWEFERPEMKGKDVRQI